MPSRPQSTPATAADPEPLGGGSGSDRLRAAARRRELGEFLRSRRERLSPADVGFPATSRRRTPGLRREELAALAGISATWYTALERGRDVRASDEVLLAIVRALRLNDVEREFLFDLADPRPRFPGVREEVAPEVARVPGLLDPAPAYVTGATADLLAWNSAAVELLPGLDSAVPGQWPNLARWVFLDPLAREVLVDWEQVARRVLARVRAGAGRNPGDSATDLLVSDLRAGSVEADDWWPRYDIAAQTPGTKLVRHPRRGPVAFSHAAFAVAGSPGQVLVVYSEVAPT